MALFFCASASANISTTQHDYSSQRQLFLEAENLLRNNKRQQFRQHLNQLSSYSLLPYLIYADYKSRLGYLSPQQIDSFNQRFGDTPIAKRLNNQWLIHLAENRRWQKLLKHYPGNGGAELDCYAVRALYHSGKKEQALSKVKPLWLVGKSQPKACDPLFRTWQESSHFNSELAWQRFQLAMERGKYRLARYLIRFTEGEQKQLAEQWHQLYRQPEKINRLNLTRQPPTLAKKIVRFGIKRLARYNASLAWTGWKKLSKKHDFNAKEVIAIERNLALASLLQKEALDRPELTQIINNPGNSDLQERRIRATIAVGNWQAMQQWLLRLSPQMQATPRWEYWSIRAAEELGTEPNEVILSRYTELAGQRHYYGFLAADRVGTDYQLNHQEIDLMDAQVMTLQTIPAFIRARELFLLDRVVDARREWRQATQRMNTQQLAQAAKLAAEWGWHDRAIHTVAQTPYRDDLELRFPLPHQQHVINEAERHQIDPAWVMAVIRQESAFMLDARSSRGALGLMQIMPRTGREIGRLLKSPLHNTANLLQSDLNIKFGTAYLRRNLNRLQNNLVSATAAYNAGYGNVRKWLPKEQGIEADRWVETIRFNETRGYVQNVMAYAAIYDQRLNRPTIRLSERMPAIQPKKQQ
ncbi:Soluble lytic murein transglycosylase precursor [hydrothermal vent metagenome]|uniref:Soluble lytic murein transglycosylase n=2 Tax=hydrothermal vent metagenome TaxID=652676 RepID=A0A3B0ZRT1_9ZZZZ